MLQHKICYPLSALSAWTTNVVPKIGHCVDLCYTVCLTSSGRKYEIIKCKDWLCVCVSVCMLCVCLCVCVCVVGGARFTFTWKGIQCLISS